MRRWSLILVGAALLAGCSPTADDRPVLRVSNWGGAGDDGEYDRLVNRMYEEFGKKNGLKVQVEGIPGEYVQKMLLNHVAGTMPDVMVVDASSAAIFVNNGMVRDLTPFIEKDSEFRLDDYWPNTLDIGRRGKALHMIPVDFTPMVVYYNKAMFDAAGVPYPTDDWNFEDFLATAKKLTIPGKQHGFVFSNWMPGWVMWLWNNGGEVLSPDGKRAAGYFDSPQNVETITFLRDLVKTHKVAPSLSETASLGVDPFANGQAAMTVSGHWGLIGYKAAPKGPDGKPRLDWTKLGVVAMPHNTPTSQTVMYEAGMGIPTKAKNPELGWKLVKEYTSYRFQSVYNASGIAICARKDVAEERAKEQIEKDFLRIVPSARPPAGSWIEGYEMVEDVGAKLIDRVLNTDVGVAKALRESAERIDREFAKS